MTGSGAKREFSGTLLNEIEVRAIAVVTKSGLTSWEDVERDERGGGWDIGERGRGDWLHGGKDEGRKVRQEKGVRGEGCWMHGGRW